MERAAAADADAVARAESLDRLDQLAGLLDEEPGYDAPLGGWVPVYNEEQTIRRTWRVAAVPVSKEIIVWTIAAQTGRGRYCERWNTRRLQFL
jgi:hypothetical protein